MNRTMKKSLAILSLSAMMTTGAAYAATNETVHTNTIMPVTTQAAPTAISVQVNEGVLSEKGYLKAAATEPMLPLRAVTESLVFKLNWKQETLSAELVDNKLYVPTSFVSKVLHGSVTTEGASVSIAMKKDVKKVQTTGVITSIRPVDDYTAIQIQGIGTEGMILNVNKDTEYQMLDGTKLSLSDLHVGLTVTAEHSMAATLSLPPQTSTSKITVLDTKREANSLGTAGVVEEVRGDDKGNMSLLVKGTGLTETSPSEVVLQISDKTAIVDKNGDKVEKAALVKGANVIGFYGPALTKSLPPTGQAWKIVVSAKQE
ncbi:hypothetical protein [Paenibacillus sp. Root444D2]|uniref:hypothetical protein n=1 Tax=Paenibacillus sp. Root444D2 TaxID=1736538 RepID=UPI000710B12B|nr:hypothetical protein [Paenibacillus sp. Root444D2]KQX60716.1 hypothetical protein ASD40_30945 [Paenibacillus sp. Root444D2]